MSNVCNKIYYLGQQSPIQLSRAFGSLRIEFICSNLKPFSTNWMIYPKKNYPSTFKISQKIIPVNLPKVPSSQPPRAAMPNKWITSILIPKFAIFIPFYHSFCLNFTELPAVIRKKTTKHSTDSTKQQKKHHKNQFKLSIAGKC